MKYFSLMTDDEIKYVCSVIPSREAVSYFKRYPKKFAKILRGFRPDSKRYGNTADLLFKHRKRDFFASFIDEQINYWIHEIQESLELCIAETSNKNIAYIRTLSKSFFAGNVALYFKLVEEDHPEIFISLLSSAVAEAEYSLKEQVKLEGDIRDKGNKISELSSELKILRESLTKIKTEQSKNKMENKRLKKDNGRLNELNTVILEKEEKNLNLETEVNNLRNLNKELKTDLAEIRNEQQLLRDKMRHEIEEQQEKNIQYQLVVSKPRHPADMLEFEDYLGYNFENIGVSTGENSLSLLKNYTQDILFQGMPIIINRTAGVNLMKCVANALVGNKYVSTLTFKRDFSQREIENFLSGDERIICLNNFLGNYNETELLALLERYRNKIIFLTIAYDKTLRYIAYEVFRYCHYLNLNRIHAFTLNTDLTEDPSVLDEKELTFHETKPDKKYSAHLRKILNDFDLPQNLTEHKCARISSDKDLSGVLVFDILPYCADVMQIAPFHVSEELGKYARRSPYKNLLLEWFQ